VFARVVLGRALGDDDEPRQDATYGGMRSPYLRRRGWRAFFTAPAMNVPVEVHVGHHVAHGRSDRSGHIDLTFRGHGMPPGWHEVTVSAQGCDPVQASVYIVAPDARFGLISDIDDTVITTSLPRPDDCRVEHLLPARERPPGGAGDGGRSIGRSWPSIRARRSSSCRRGRGTPRRR
jgi:hypothetical protein